MTPDCNNLEGYTNGYKQYNMTSIFNTCVLYEQTEKNRVKNLLAGGIDFVAIADRGKFETYKKSHLRNYGYRVEYAQPELKDFGRVKQIPFTGLGTFTKEQKGYLAEGIYIDVDMVNCHPCIILSELEKRGIDPSVLKEYVNDRDNFLKRENIAKEDFLKVLYSDDGATEKIKNEKLRKLKKTLDDTYIPLIIEENSKMYSKVIKTKAYNQKGSFFANYIQNIEFKLLTALYIYCRSNEILIDTLMHDGFYVRITKTINEETIKEKFPEFTELIKEDYGINMLFKVKEHDQTYKKKLEELQKTPIQREYSNFKERFEKNHCKIINRAFFLKILPTKEIIIMQKKDLEVAYSHELVEDPDILSREDCDRIKPDVSAIKLWLIDPEMRRYEDFGSYPSDDLCPPAHYNTWLPFRCETLDNIPNADSSEKMHILLNHIKILCKNEDVMYQWLIRWIGQMLKHPEHKTFCPVLISKEGAGKGTFYRTLEQLIGARKILETTSAERDVWGSFNDLLSHSYLVCINEMSKKETYNSMGKIKGLITDKNLIINKKGISQYQVSSYHRFMITTNADDPIETSHNDRRFVIIRSSDEKIGDYKYFTDISNIINDDSVIVCLYNHLIGLDGLDTFHSQRPPTTSYHENLKELTVSPVELFLKSLCHEYNEKSIEISNYDFFDKFKKFCEENSINTRISSIQLGVSVSNGGYPGITTSRTSSSRSKKIDLTELRKYFGICSGKITDCLI